MATRWAAVGSPATSPLRGSELKRRRVKLWLSGSLEPGARRPAVPSAGTQNLPNAARALAIQRYPRTGDPIGARLHFFAFCTVNLQRLNEPWREQIAP